MNTVKGTFTGLSGAQYDSEATNTIKGRAPDTVWLALDDYDEDDYALIALVGFEGAVMKFAQRVGKKMLQPVGLLRLPDLPPEAPGFAVACVGQCPNNRARAVVLQLSGGGRHGWRRWARELLLVRQDLAWRPVGAPDQMLTKELVALFLEQCRAATQG